MAWALVERLLTVIGYPGQTTQVWWGTQSQYNSLPSATRNRVGFIAYITT